MVAKEVTNKTASYDYHMTDPREKPEDLTRSERLKRFFYNHETGEIMGRTPISWGKIGLFYLLFYICLAALCAICFWVFFRTIDPRTPKWQLDKSIIGTNPGLGFRPLPPSQNVESTLIYYTVTDKANYEFWEKSLEEFLEVYRTPGVIPGQGANIYNCDYDNLPGPGQVCQVNLKDWTPCTKENHYGYHKSSPCIFLKLNKIFGWRPDYYNDTNQLPEKMPVALKNHIKTLKQIERNTVWVSCEGENPADKEFIGPIDIYPRQGFPGYFFPFENSEGYLSPLVAVHFPRPQKGILINVECKAWAKNIIHNRADKMGSVHFELLID